MVAENQHDSVRIRCVDDFLYPVLRNLAIGCRIDKRRSRGALRQTRSELANLMVSSMDGRYLYLVAAAVLCIGAGLLIAFFLR